VARRGSHVEFVDPGDLQQFPRTWTEGRMTVVLYLLGGSLMLGGAALAWFLWSLRTGQYEDMEGAANRILFDDDAR
jgi:cbb3-type cytochrome oxidase maturation protein